MTPEEIEKLKRKCVPELHEDGYERGHGAYMIEKTIDYLAERGMFCSPEVLEKVAGALIEAEGALKITRMSTAYNQVQEALSALQPYLNQGDRRAENTSPAQETTPGRTGWVMVPIEPTEKMIDAYLHAMLTRPESKLSKHESVIKGHKKKALLRYRAMISAAQKELKHIRKSGG